MTQVELTNPETGNVVTMAGPIPTLSDFEPRDGWLLAAAVGLFFLTKHKTLALVIGGIAVAEVLRNTYRRVSVQMGAATAD